MGWQRTALAGLIVLNVHCRRVGRLKGAGSLALAPRRLVGKYDSIVAFGQERALVVWQRIILPDGSSIVIDNLPATDTGGYAGLADEIDAAWRRTRKGSEETYLSVKLDDPALPQPIWGALLEGRRHAGAPRLAARPERRRLSAVSLEA